MAQVSYLGKLDIYAINFTMFWEINKGQLVKRPDFDHGATLQKWQEEISTEKGKNTSSCLKVSLTNDNIYSLILISNVSNVFSAKENLPIEKKLKSKLCVEQNICLDSKTV